MIHQSFLLRDTVQFDAGDAVLILNSALDPLVQQAQLTLNSGTLTLAEDNVAAAGAVLSSSARRLAVRHVAFHDYIIHSPAGTMDVAAMNLLYQPGNVWIQHGLQVALYTLRPGGRLYVTGAKERGILSTAKRMQEHFGNVETLQISKGQRVVCSRRREGHIELGVLGPIIVGVIAGLVAWALVLHENSFFALMSGGILAGVSGSNFLTSQAQAQGYFAKIDYLPIVEFDNPDGAIASRAVEVSAERGPIDRILDVALL